MSFSHHLRLLLPLLVISPCSGLAQPLSSTLAACTELVPNEQRLACFDAAVADFLQPAAPPSPAAVPSKEILPTTADSEFGMNAGIAQQRDPERPSASPKRLQATVTRIDKRASGALVVTLENAQVWQQARAEQGLRVQPGDTVTLKQGAFGSYRLIGRGNKAYKVKRIR